MRMNLVARFDKPVLRRLFKSSPEQVVMRTSDEKGKGSEKLFGYGGVYECPHVLCFCLFIHVQVLALIFLCKKQGDNHFCNLSRYLNINILKILL